MTKQAHLWPTGLNHLGFGPVLEKGDDLNTLGEQVPADRNHPSVSLEAEVPEALFEGMRNFISTHPHWDQYSVITSALAGFLFQNGSCEGSVRDHYLAGLFLEP